ncbi:MAG: ExeM/NucH family extracellular endonuclease [Flavobacteriales bacterium]|nr:ExeM/NucH family extracellular endonuclease [Flavobacteriales bacterium]
MRLLASGGLMGVAIGLAAQTPICSIQGSGESSPLQGQAVTTTGIVTAIYSGSGTVQGLFLEDPGCDSDPATSNGLFVYSPNTSGISTGQRVSVSGTVLEFQGLTEISQVTGISVIGSGTVAPSEINLPVASAADWERYEGMLLRFPQQLVVNGNDTWAQYGELVLAPSRLHAPSDITDPNDNPASGTNTTGSSNVGAINALVELQLRGTILLDDGRTSTYPSPPPLIGGQGTLRCGGTVTGLTGVLHYAFGAYRIHPAGAVPLQHAQRPSVPEVGGSLRVAALNVKNYFTSLGGNGASTANELLRQRTKLVAALQGLEADAYVLCELQNSDAASNDLLAALNTAMGGGYAVIDQDAPGAFTRTIFFYRTSTLTPITQLFSLSTSTFERAHLTQGFASNASGKRFLLSGTHLRSKICDNASGSNLDQGDGQGCYNARRRSQVNELITHWDGVRASTWIPGQLILGDFNAYDQEDPIDRMRASGLIDMIAGVPEPYSYRYADRSGSLDHAFAIPAMADAITGAAVWHINSDEPPNLDYRDSNTDFYQANAFRSSDHDPLLIGIDVEAIPVGLEEVPGGQVAVRYRYDPTSGSADWEGEGLERIEVFDALGRTVRIASADGSGTVRISAAWSGAGPLVWRAWLREGTVAGRFVAL